MGFLVLSRHVDESIVIRLPDGRDVELKVLKIKPGQVQLALDAPSDVLIKRSEINWDDR